MINDYKVYISKKKKKTILLIMSIIIITFALGLVIDFSIVKIFKGIPSMYSLFERILRPNLSYIEEVFSKLLETIEIAIISSIIGVALSIPFSLLISRNIAPSKHISMILNALFSILRTIPSLIWAALLVSVFSIGKFSGVLALTIIAFLMSLKLFKEHIETINENIINSTRSVGANQIQILRYCILPTILDILISVLFIVLETNIRSATVLGLVGAGGIGQIMWRDLNHLRYDNLSTLILILFLTIVSIDTLSLLIRNLIKKSSITYTSLECYRKFHNRRRLFYISIFIILIALILISIDVDYERLKIGFKQGLEIITRIIDIDISYFPKLFEGIKESLAIAIFATVLGAAGALVLSFFSSYNTSPSKYISILFKGLINILRTFPPIITAIIFFRGVGPGPLAGSLALSIYTAGVLTKLYSDIIESSSENIKNSILVTGSTNLTSFRYGILLQTLPNFISLSLYRLESNIRNSTILGIIGAGGIGTILNRNITWRNWERVGTLILGISIMIILIDILSYSLRKKLL